MGRTRLRSRSRVALVWFGFSLVLLGSCLARFADIFDIAWGRENVVANDDANSVSISLTQNTGARLISHDSYLYGAFTVKVKLVPGYSAGTVCSFYLSSGDGGNHDEIDFEFLGNVSGQPYVVHTNLFANDGGLRENRMFLWFDPTADFHEYRVIWNHKQIVWYIDGVPIRVYKNIEDVYPNSYLKSGQTAFASIFDGSDWATRGGRDPVNWQYAPFTAVYKDFSFDACEVNDNSCNQNYAQNWWEAPGYQSLDDASTQKMKDTLRQYMIYGYCTDRERIPTVPKECAYNV